VYEGDMDPRVDAVQHWIDRGWLDAAILHLKSRDLSFIDDRVDDPESVKRAVLLDEVESNPPPAFWKNYPSSQKIFLPKPTDLPSDRLLPEVLLARRSLAPYRGGGLNAIELGNILHYASLETVRLRTAAEETLRTSPELLLASSFSAIEIYPIILDVEGIAPGLYHFDPRDGGLSLLKSGYFREEAAKVCIGQSRAGASGVTLVFTAVWERYMYRYRHARAYRNLLINVAQLAQKILVLATSYRLGTFMTPAIDDEYAEQFLNLQWQEEAPLYVVAAG
jgi:SagB-type dehydrogenase family enzyme